jgi:hypothetical protein
MRVRGALAGGTLPAVDTDSLARAAALLRKRNEIDAELARLMHRPLTSGHLGEWIAAQVFDIELQASAVAAGVDGHFRSGPLPGRTVNIKWYLKREGALDTTESTHWITTWCSPDHGHRQCPHEAPPGPGASKPCICLRRGNFGPSRSREE